MLQQTQAHDSISEVLRHFLRGCLRARLKQCRRVMIECFGLMFKPIVGSTCSVTSNCGAYPLLHIVVGIWQGIFGMRQSQLLSRVLAVQPAVMLHQVFRVSETEAQLGQLARDSSLRQSQSQVSGKLSQLFLCLRNLLASCNATAGCTAKPAISVGCVTSYYLHQIVF